VIVSASRELAAPPDVVFAFLADLENHWMLASDWVEVVALDRVDGGPARGGRVRLHGPFGLRRTAQTRMLELEPCRRVAGTAAVGRHTLARVAWDLAPSAGGTRVTVSAAVQRLGLGDRVLWALVGRRVMQRGFPAVLRRLQTAIAVPDSGSVALSAQAPPLTTR
jgi:uncharacterized protein YndB with AHSA1/START domain